MIKKMDTLIPNIEYSFRQPKLDLELKLRLEIIKLYSKN